MPNAEDLEYCFRHLFIYHLPILAALIFFIIIVSTSLGYIIHYIKYDGWLNLFSSELWDVISLPRVTILFFVISIIFILLSWSSIPKLDSKSAIFIGVPLYIIINVIIKYNEMDMNPLFAFKQIQAQGLGYGNCMADSYFNGYLRIILPDDGKEGTLGMLERIRNYQARENVKVSIQKLFILIPFSGYLPPSLESPENWIEGRKPLETQQLNRGGVLGRVYKNSVYSIGNPDVRPVTRQFVVLEGASPIQTLLEGTTANTNFSLRLREHKKKIIYQFYKALKVLLESDQGFYNLYELVYYDDEGGSRNVGKMILDQYFKGGTTK